MMHHTTKYDWVQCQSRKACLHTNNRHESFDHQSVAGLECLETLEAFSELESDEDDSLVIDEEHRNDDHEDDDDDYEEDSKPKISIAKPSSIVEDSFCSSNNYGDLIIEEVSPTTALSHCSGSSMSLEEEFDSFIDDFSEEEVVDAEVQMDSLHLEYLSQQQQRRHRPLHTMKSEHLQQQNLKPESSSSSNKTENLTLAMLLDDQTFGRDRLRDSLARKKTIRELARQIPNPMPNLNKIKTKVPETNLPYDKPTIIASKAALRPIRPKPILTAHSSASAFALKNPEQLTTTVPVNKNDLTSGSQLGVSNPHGASRVNHNYRRRFTYSCPDCRQTFASTQSRKNHMRCCSRGTVISPHLHSPAAASTHSLGLKRLGKLIPATTLIQKIKQQQQCEQQNRAMNQHQSSQAARSTMSIHNSPASPILNKLPFPTKFNAITSSTKAAARSIIVNGGSSSCSFLSLQDLLDTPTPTPAAENGRNGFQDSLRVNHFDRLRFGSTSLLKLAHQSPNFNYNSSSSMSMVNNVIGSAAEDDNEIQVKEEITIPDLNIQFEY